MTDRGKSRITNTQDRQKIKIVYISVVHPLHDHRFLYKQCKGLTDNGFDVEYYVQSPKESVINNVHIKPLQSHRSRIARFLSTLALLPKLLRSKCDAIHLVDPELLPMGMILKLLTKTIVIFDNHEDYSDFMRHKSYLNPFLAKLFSFGINSVLYLSSLLFDGFVFADEGTAAKLGKLPSHRKSFFFNFPMLSMFPRNPQRWVERKYDVAFVGTMSRTSGTFVVLEAVNIVKKRIPSLRCLFIGNPQQDIQQEVEHHIEQNGLNESVEFTGRVPYRDVPKLLQSCKVGLIGLLNMPKFQNNIATKMFEYMASGVPVVSVDLPPERRFISDGEHGYLVPPEDPSAMAKAICKILSNPTVGQEMSERCYSDMLTQKYFGEYEVEKLVEFYKHLLNHRRRILCGI